MCNIGLQLDWLKIAEWAYAGIFAAEVRFQIRDQFWIPQPKLHGACYLIFLQNLKTFFLCFLLVFLRSIKIVIFRGF